MKEKTIILTEPKTLYNVVYAIARWVVYHKKKKCANYYDTIITGVAIVEMYFRDCNAFSRINSHWKYNFCYYIFYLDTL